MRVWEYRGYAPFGAGVVGVVWERGWRGIRRWLWIVTAARRGPGASRLPTRGIFHHFIRFIPAPQSPTLPQFHNLLPSFLSFMVYAFVFDGLTFTLMVGSAEKGAITFFLRECAPQDCSCPFPRNVGGWAVVWGFKCSHFIFVSCSSIITYRPALYR